MDDAAWQTIMFAYGPLGAIVAGIGALVWKYAPRLVENHVQFTATVVKQGEQMVVTLKKFSDTFSDLTETTGEKFRDHHFSTLRTNRALLSMADAIAAGAKELGPNVSEAVAPHIVAIKNAILSRKID
jgi:hypothetical protein